MLYWRLCDCSGKTHLLRNSQQVLKILFRLDIPRIGEVAQPPPVEPIPERLPAVPMPAMGEVNEWASSFFVLAHGLRVRSNGQEV